jgi:hypothetical protein
LGSKAPHRTEVAPQDCDFLAALLARAERCKPARRSDEQPARTRAEKLKIKAQLQGPRRIG